METLVVVTQAGDWPLQLEGARLVTAKQYLTDPEFTDPDNRLLARRVAHFWKGEGEVS